MTLTAQPKAGHINARRFAPMLEHHFSALAYGGTQ